MKKRTRYILSKYGGKAVKRTKIENVCKKFDVNPSNTINNMISYGYMIRILRGLYYVKTLDEFVNKKAVDVHKIISLGLEELGVKWYFGLNTALRMNGATHEYSDTVFVLNDEIYRNKEIKIANTKVKFIKINSKLFGFGVIKENTIRYSNLEKTLLDMIYLSRYRSIPEGRIVTAIEEYGNNADHNKIREYLKAYTLKVGEVAKNAGLV